MRKLRKILAPLAYLKVDLSLSELLWSFHQNRLKSFDSASVVWRIMLWILLLEQELGLLMGFAHGLPALTRQVFHLIFFRDPRMGARGVTTQLLARREALDAELAVEQPYRGFWNRFLFALCTNIIYFRGRHEHFTRPLLNRFNRFLLRNPYRWRLIRESRLTGARDGLRAALFLVHRSDVTLEASSVVTHLGFRYVKDVNI